MIDELRKAGDGGRLKWLLRDSVVYGGLGATTRLLGVFLIPIVVRVFTVAEYGTVDSLTVLHEMLVAACLLGMNQSTERFIAEVEDPEESRQIVGQGLFVSLAFSAAVCLLLWPLGGPLASAWLGTSDETVLRAYFLMLSGIPLIVVLHFAKGLLKWNFRRRQYVLLSVTEVVTMVGTTVWFVAGLRWGIVGLFLARLLGATVTAGLAAVFCHRYWSWPKRFSHVRSLFAFGSPLMVVSFAHQLVSALERLVVTHVLGLSALGLYAVGHRFARLITFFTQGFQVAWGPFAYAIYRERDGPQTLNRALLWYTATVGTACVALVAVAKPALIAFASNRYIDSLEVLVPLLFAHFIQSIGSVTGLGILLAKRTSLAAFCYAGKLLVVAIGLACLVRPFGIVGAGYAFLLGTAFHSVLESLVAKSVYPVRYSLFAAAQIVAGLFGLALVLQYLLF